MELQDSLTWQDLTIADFFQAVKDSEIFTKREAEEFLKFVHQWEVMEAEAKSLQKVNQVESKMNEPLDDLKGWLKNSKRSTDEGRSLTSQSHPAEQSTAVELMSRHRRGWLPVN